MAKRSEFVELLRSHIVNCDGLSEEYLEDQTDVASYILGKLEKAGMVPPDISDVAYEPSNVWEPEDGTKKDK